ncbi:MAG: hypoxanthine phosphoribosyltransferase [Opitutales bacterium]
MDLKSHLARIVVDADAIRARVRELGEQITRDFRAAGADEITVISITNGAVLFAADLLRELDLPVRLDCVRAANYRDETKPVTRTEIIDQIRLDISGTHTLLIDDVMATGRTLRKLVGILEEMKPANLRTCVLLEKPSCRVETTSADYTGFAIGQEFVVGYGLDFAERYRNLPCIGTLRPELQNPPTWC